MLIGLWTLRLGSPTWPDRAHIMNIRLVGVMTVILICSSTTMALSVYQARRGQRRRAVWFLAATIIAGLTFAGLQATEWTHFIQDGARLNGNPWGVPPFSFTFFIITGYHGLHVVAGCFYLWVMAVRIAKGAIRRRRPGGRGAVLGLRRPRLGLHLAVDLPAVAGRGGSAREGASDAPARRAGDGT